HEAHDPIDTVEHVEPDARTDATVDSDDSTTSIDSILSRFDAAIERLQSTVEPELEAEPAKADDPDVPAEPDAPGEPAEPGVDTGPSPVPDLELPVSPDLDDDADTVIDAETVDELFAELDDSTDTD